jgi:two-component system nitrogen regulation sensor histidine kinase GlnL
MRMNSIVWKVNSAFIVVIVVVIGASAYLSNRIYERDTLALARTVSKFQLETIRQSLKKLMHDRDNAGIQEVIKNLPQSDPVYRDIRLASHAGNVVASESPIATPLAQESKPCAVCHMLDDPSQGINFGSYDEVVRLADGTRAVSVVTPILNERSCSTADCHAHPESTQVLGLLQASFSLENVDDLISQSNLHTVLAILVAVVLSMVASWLTLDRLVGRRLNVLNEGMQRVANNDFSFRFEDARKDEIATLAHSFDGMTSRLSSTLTALRDTKDYLEGIVENSADIIVTVDPDGLIRTVNKGAENTLGYERDELIGQKIELLFADPRERDVAIARLAHTDNTVNYETHFLTKQGEVRDVILTLSRLRAPDGTAIGTFGISKDVTQEKRLQRELILKEKFAAIGQAVTSIQHAMKNMLGSLKGGSYMVNTGFDEDDRTLLGEGWAMVQEGISDITDLSSRMLHYVREWEPELEETNLGDLLTSVYNVSRATARGMGIELRLEVALELSTIICDRRLIHSATMDLLSNAMDACLWKDYGELETPEVVLRARSAQCGRNVLIEVQDNGQGMTEEIKKNIFTPFFSTKTRLGTGMGLTLTSRIIQLHGGSIEVESEPRHGATFRVSLPYGGPQEKKEDYDAQESPSH